MAHQLVGSVVRNSRIMKICTILSVTVEYLDQDVQKKSYTEKAVTSSETFQKSVKQWSVSLGFNIEATVGGFGGGGGMTTEFSNMNSEELKKTNYQMNQTSKEKRYSPDSRQLIRQEDKKIILEYTVGRETSFTEGIYSSEKHVGSVNKKLCPDPEKDSLFKKAIGNP